MAQQSWLLFYPYPRSIQPWWQILTVAALLLIITIAVIRLGRKYKYLPTGWFWYLGTLLPVIGIVQVGMQSMADRYTYIPFIGLFIILAWGANDLLSKWKYAKIVLWPLSFSVIIVLAVLTWFQVRCWRDSISSFRPCLGRNGEQLCGLQQPRIRALRKRPVRPGHFGLQKSSRDKSRNTIRPTIISALLTIKKVSYDLAVQEYNKALEINPEFFEAVNNRGLAYYEKGEFDHAISDYTKALEINPPYDMAYYNRANAYARGKGLYDLAIADYDKAIEINPRYALAYYQPWKRPLLEGTVRPRHLRL